MSLGFFALGCPLQIARCVCVCVCVLLKPLSTLKSFFVPLHAGEDSAVLKVQDFHMQQLTACRDGSANGRDKF